MRALKHNILLIGDFSSLSSISIINNTLLKMLQAKGFNVHFVENFKKPLSKEQWDMVITHNWPPVFNLDKFKTCKKSIILPWEYEAIPVDWVPHLNSIFDEIWVPSVFTKNSLINSSVFAEKIYVIPNGFNPNVFYIKHKGKFDSLTDKRIKFLFVGGSIRRKGIDILLDAYINTFSPKDRVSLIIKDFGTSSFYANQNFKNRIIQMSKERHMPEIIYIEEDLNEAELNDLYNFSSCLVLPYRGEGFGMPVLEAMACGKPVVVTKGGATDDFCKEEFAYLIESMKIRHKMKALNLAKPRININTPKANHLSLLMAHIYQNIEEAEEKGRKACEFVSKNYTWNHVVEEYCKRIVFLLK